jgi:predicted metal-binding protein
MKGLPMTDTYDNLVKKALELGATDARLIDTNSIVFDPRSYIKCRFGCNRWGQYWTCPPHLSISTEMFMDAFGKYTKALIIQTADPRTGQDVTLAIEKEAMLAANSPFAFAMVLCVQCETCAYPEPCRYPRLARPSMDAYGIDIGATIAPLGFTIKFDPDGHLLPAWYSMVLVA